MDRNELLQNVYNTAYVGQLEKIALANGLDPEAFIDGVEKVATSLGRRLAVAPRQLGRAIAGEYAKQKDSFSALGNAIAGRAQQLKGNVAASMVGRNADESVDAALKAKHLKYKGDAMKGAYRGMTGTRGAGRAAITSALGLGTVGAGGYGVSRMVNKDK